MKLLQLFAVLIGFSSISLAQNGLTKDQYNAIVAGVFTPLREIDLGQTTSDLVKQKMPTLKKNFPGPPMIQLYRCVEVVKIIRPQVEQAQKVIQQARTALNTFTSKNKLNAAGTTYVSQIKDAINSVEAGVNRWDVLWKAFDKPAVGFTYFNNFVFTENGASKLDSRCKAVSGNCKIDIQWGKVGFGDWNSL